MMSEPSTPSDKPVSTSLPPGFPASPSASPVSDAATRTSATSGPPPRPCFAWYDHATHSWRTSQRWLHAATSGESSVTWPRSGSMRNGRCYPHKMPVRRTSGSDCGSWPTPTVGDSRNSRNATANRRSSTSFHAGETLSDATWAIPTATDYKNRTLSKDDCCLAQQVPRLNPSWVELLMGWPLGWTLLPAGLLPVAKRKKTTSRRVLSSPSTHNAHAG